MGAFKPSERGPVANIPAIQNQYQFLSSLSPTGDSAYGPTYRVYAQATTEDMKHRMQNSQNVLGLTKKQVAINEKTLSGKSNVVSSQFHYTTDYWQLPKTVQSLIPDLTAGNSNLPWILAGVLTLYILFAKSSS